MITSLTSRTGLDRFQDQEARSYLLPYRNSNQARLDTKHMADQNTIHNLVHGRRLFRCETIPTVACDQH